MLEQLFGSHTRVKLLRFFFRKPEEPHFVRELTRAIGQRINSVRRELLRLERIGLLTSEARGQKKYFRVNEAYTLYPELKALLLKSHLTIESDLVSKLKKLGRVSYVCLTGFFTGNTEAKTDLLLVGQLNRKRLEPIMRALQKGFAQDINYTVMSKKEFLYRNSLTDRFLYDILEHKKIVLFDRLFPR